MCRKKNRSDVLQNLAQHRVSAERALCLLRIEFAQFVVLGDYGLEVVLERRIILRSVYNNITRFQDRQGNTRYGLIHSVGSALDIDSINNQDRVLSVLRISGSRALSGLKRDGRPCAVRQAVVDRETVGRAGFAS